MIHGMHHTTRTHVIIFMITLMLMSNACKPQKVNEMSESNTTLITREPVVAGRFYPGTSSELKTELAKHFNEYNNSSETGSIQADHLDIIAIISPHAGYVFSGTVAASAFHQLDPDARYNTIFLIGSSHQAYFKGASIYNKGHYMTPLGKVEVDLETANQLLNNNPVFSYKQDAHRSEHSLEVQLPFLQYRLKNSFKIVPIILGSQDKLSCREIAKALQPYFNKKNLFVISTDFSHYPEYEDACSADKTTSDAILTNDPENLLKAIKLNTDKKIDGLSTSCCGWTSVLTLMYLTENNPEIKYQKIMYRNSGDAEIYGDKSRVVGYCSIVAGTEKKNKRTEEFGLTEENKKELLVLARNTLDTYIKTGIKVKLNKNDFSREISQNSGAFVTLHKNSNLRGCIGMFNPDIPLYQVIQDMAIASATRDTRFPPVKKEELKDIDIEISVLTPLKKIDSVDEIKLGKNGIYIKKGYRSGTFLPQVATQTGWSLEEFLGHCARDKAGLGWDGWKDAELFIYSAIIFDEKELH